LYIVNCPVDTLTTVLNDTLLMYFIYHSACYRTVSKSVVFIPVHDIWNVNKIQIQIQMLSLAKVM